jgi:hypothetical protein
MMNDGRDGAYLFLRLMTDFRWTRQAPTADADCSNGGRERR